MDRRPIGEKNGGADGDRTHDLMNAIHALSQLSYSPTFKKINTKKYHLSILRRKRKESLHF